MITLIDLSESLFVTYELTNNINAEIVVLPASPHLSLVISPPRRLSSLEQNPSP